MPDYKNLNLKPLLAPPDGVKDPPRYPKIIIPIENEAKSVGMTANKKMIIKLAEEMAKMIK
jgi:hypothetical protein